MFKFLFLTEVANVNYSDRMVFIKFRQNLWKNLWRSLFFSELVESTALLKKYVLYSYFRKILVKVRVIANCIKAINILMPAGNQRSYTYT